MAFLTPAEISTKAVKAYDRFLVRWIAGEDDGFFPCRWGTGFRKIQADSYGDAIHASRLLLAGSKQEKGVGYTVHREDKSSRDLGRNPVPTQISIDTLDDLLSLAKKKSEFAATNRVASFVRSAFPRLETWLRSNVKRLHARDKDVEGLIAVAQHFVEHPRPDCYARQLAVAVDTKFIERHEKTLRQWLDVLLPPEAIDANEKDFARRFGLRDKQPHRAVRVLDPLLQNEIGLPFDEMSLPLRSIAQLPVANATVVIVENRINLLTLPPVTRGLGIRGEGDDVYRLQRIPWLKENRVLYWGDIDVPGLLILSRLRNHLPRVESVLMDGETLERHRSAVGRRTAKSVPRPTNLTPGEAAAFDACAADSLWLEQEKIPQAAVIEALRAVV